MNTANLRMLEKVSYALGDVCDRVKFIGGAAVGLYFSAAATSESRSDR
jgi:hypothetical protein